MPFRQQHEPFKKTLAGLHNLPSAVFSIQYNLLIKCLSTTYNQFMVLDILGYMNKSKGRNKERKVGEYDMKDSAVYSGICSSNYSFLLEVFHQLANKLKFPIPQKSFLRLCDFLLSDFFLSCDDAFLGRVVCTCLHFCSLYLFYISTVSAHFSICYCYLKIWVPLQLREGALLLQRLSEMEDTGIPGEGGVLTPTALISVNW